jgi:glycosyltransferase involved in cell wall biosynthesis
MINHPPLVSVLMPTYNAERYLSQAIRSILSQTFTDFEFIVVDDGSADQTPTILKIFQSQDTRFEIHYFEKNSGIAAALNKGLSIAQGKYIARMDADDISLPERFSKQVAFMESHPAVGVLGTGATVIDAADRPHQSLVFPLSHLLLQWSMCFYSPMIHPSVMIRRELLLSAGGYLPTAAHAEDYELWGRLSAATQFANLPDRLLLLRKSGSNVSIRYSAAFLAAGISVSKGMFRSLIGLDVPVTPFELTLQPRRISPTDLRRVSDAMITLLNHFLNLPGITAQEQHYLQHETALRFIRLIPSSASGGSALDLLALAFKCDPLAFMDFPRLAFRKLISR